MNKTVELILLACLSVVPCCAFSQTLMECDSVVHREVGEVSVVAYRQGEVVASQWLGGEELKSMNALSVADAVRYFSGVQIKDYGGVGGMKTVDIRSMGSNHLGVFYDGLQIGNAQNGTVDLGKFSLDNVEEVRVYNGQKSEVFQPAKDFGTSGSLYLKTRRPVFEEGKKYNISVRARGGSFGMINGSVLYEQKVGGCVSFSMNGEYTKAHGKYKFRYHKTLEDLSGNIVTAWDTTGTRQNGDVEALRLEASVMGMIEGGQWHGKVYYYNSEKGIPRAIVRNVWTSSQRQWDRDFFVQGSWQKGSADRSEHRLSTKYSRDYMRYLNPDTTLLYVDNNFTQEAIYVSSSNCMHFTPMWDVDLSVDYEHNWMESNMVNFASPRRDVLLCALATALNLQKMKVQGSLLGNFIHDKTTKSTQQSGDFSNWTRKLTPALFLSWRPFESVDGGASPLIISAFYKKMFRMPTFNDLYYTDLGNISLKPEYATQYDLGVAYKMHSRMVDVDVNVESYWNKIDNKIVAVPKGNSQYRWMMMNIGKVDIKGIETRGRIMLTRGELSVWANVTYTFQKALDITDKTDNGPRGTYEGQISYIPRHSGSAIVGGEYCGWHLNYSFIYVGERYHVSANIPENYEPAWYTHDLNVSKELEVGTNCKMRIGCEVNNILDQQYDVVLNYPMPGRNFKGSFKIDI